MTTDSIDWLDRGWFGICYGFCPDEASWHREMKRMKCDVPYPDTHARVTFFEQNGGIEACCIVTFDKEVDNRPLVDVVGVVFHEAVHVWQYTIEHIGEDKPGVETEAYSIQKIGQNILESYCDYRTSKAFGERRVKPKARK